MLGLTTSLNIVISNYFHKSCIQLYVKVSELWCTISTLSRGIVMLLNLLYFVTFVLFLWKPQHRQIRCDGIRLIIS